MSTKKNRAKNLRSITVNGLEYTWLISNHNCDGDGGCELKVWKDKVLLIEEPIAGHIAVTPAIVADKIKTLKP